jgi:hypothetical protein
MINYVLIYAIFMSLFILWFYHGKVIVPGRESGILRGFIGAHLTFFGKAWLLAGIIIAGCEIWGPASHGYLLWFDRYFADHSGILWTITTLPITLILWICWAATRTSMSKPGGIGWFGDNSPQLHKISMKLPAMWFLAFYGWLLLSPTLPFFSCFIRIFCLRTPVSIVFGY